MIRFCNVDVYYIDYYALSDGAYKKKEDLLSYFLDGHQNDVICIYNNDNMRFEGIITSQSLNRYSTICGAIRTEYLVLDENIWRNAREYCKRHPYSGTKYLIPVLNKDNQLFCFAYEDLDANREIRMLRELTELPDALQFTDIYPEYKCVKMHEFNELAFYFAKYLEKLGITVQVTGNMWQIFFEGQKCDSPDYECLTIYAEGIDKKEHSWKKNLLRSVSVEFEYIDQIYEENLKRGYIKDADGDYENLVAKLNGMEPIVIFGTDIAAQDAYSHLMQMGIEANCFVSDGKGIYKDRLLGKPILKLQEVTAKYGNKVIFIECHEKNSAWGIGLFGINYLDYLGYERNKRFYCLKDYMQLQGNSLKSVLKERKVVLTGDYYLCEQLAKYLESSNCCHEEICYLVLHKMDFISDRIKAIELADLDKDALCLIVIPDYIYTVKDNRALRRKIRETLDSNGKFYYTDYFSYIEAFINIEKETLNKYPHQNLRVKRIVLGSIEACSGNVFFRGLLDSHPAILSVDYGYFNSNLFWYCICLAGRNVDEIIKAFEQLYCFKCASDSLKEKAVFIDAIRKLLEKKGTYTSQELFVAFHMAYVHMFERSVSDVSNMVIYWEPHNLSTDILESCVQCFEEDEVQCNIMNIVRNSYTNRGSLLKGVLKLWRVEDKNCICAFATESYGINEEDYSNSKRVVIKFEDLKRNPQEVLGEVCKEWEIPWSDSLMRTTWHGEKLIYDNGKKMIEDFDLSPVYDKYEEYFSEFDRFRITLLNSPWQRIYKYFYVDITLFSRRELQEMFLKRFRFMDEMQFDSETDELDYYINLQYDIKKTLQKNRLFELLRKV